MALFLSSVEALGPNLLRATFTGSVDPASVYCPDDWGLDLTEPSTGIAKVIGVQFDPIGPGVFLLDVAPGLSSGTVYRLTATGAKEAGTGNPPSPAFLDFGTPRLSWDLPGVPPSAAFVNLPDSPDRVSSDLYKLLPKGLRDFDTESGGEFLRRFLQGPGARFDATQRAINRLPSLVDPTKAPAEGLQFLRSHVGFGAGSGLPDEIASRLSDRDLRKLIGIAVPYWKARGTKDGLSDAIRTLASWVRPAIDSWVDLRTFVDEALLGETGEPGRDLALLYDSIAEVPIGVSSGGEFETSIRVPDLGDLDRELVRDLCRLSRVPSERYELAFVDFLDTFVDGRLGHWVSYGPAAVYVPADRLSNPVTLPGLRLLRGSRERVSVPKASAWSRYVWKTILAWDLPGPIELRFYVQDDSNFYAVRLTPPGLVEIVAVIGGTETDILTDPHYPDLRTPARRAVRVEVDSADSVNEIRVYVDGDLAGRSEGDSSLAWGTVEVYYGTDPGTHPEGAVVLNRTELFCLPLSVEWIGPTI